MRIAIIGTGRMGFAQARLARAFGDIIQFGVERNYLVGQGFSKEFDIPCFEFIQQANWCDIDLIWVTVTDDEIENVALELQGKVQPTSVILHTSGAHSSKVLKKHLYINPCASVHPLISCPLTNVTDDACIEAYQGVLHTVEGDADALMVAERLVDRLQGKCIRICTDNKALYHAGAVIASNYPVVLLQLAIEMLEKCGFEHQDALAGGRRLLMQSAIACQTAEPLDALTGPAKRGDHKTIGAHQTVLQGEKDWLSVYDTMLDATFRALKRGVN